MGLSDFLARQLGHPSGFFVGAAAFVWNRRNRALNQATLDALRLETDDRVLELGFGGGYLLGRMAEVVSSGFLAGVDISPGMVAHCRRQFQEWISAGRMQLECAPAEKLPFQGEMFDKICSVNSIFYWPDVERAVVEIGRVLVPGGEVVLCFTEKGALSQKSFAKDLNLYTAGEIETTLASKGFVGICHDRLEDRHREFICMWGRKG